MNADGSSNRQITRDSWQESQPVWIKDGKKIAFLCNESGSSQVWEMNPDGTNETAHPVRGRHRGIRFLARRQEAAFHCAGKNRAEHRRQASRPAQGNRYHRYRLDVQALGRMGNNLASLSSADFDGNGISNVQDILDGEPYESPMKPWGGIEQLAWSPASDKVAYTCRKKTGLAYAVSTNSDIYIYDLATGKTENITEENKGYDTNPNIRPTAST